MAEQFSTIQTLVKDRLGRPGDADATFVASVKRWINDAMREAQNRHPFQACKAALPWFLRLTQNRAVYGTTAGFPTDFLAPAGEDWVSWFQPNTLYKSSQTGLFSVTSTITGSLSLATATFWKDSTVAENVLYITLGTGIFRAGETITDSVTGATATVDELVDSSRGLTALKPFTDREELRRYSNAVASIPERWRLDLPATATTGFEIGPRPDTSYTYILKLEYYKYLAELSADGDTNWFVANAPMMLAAGALRYAHAAAEQLPESGLANAEFEQELRKAKNQDKIDRTSEWGNRLAVSFGAKRTRRW